MILQSLIIAFAMYSKIPMPRVTWNEKNMRYAMCFFPLIGAVIGGAMYGVMRVAMHYDMGVIMYAVLMTILPLLITGGIHMDGFMDTVDAVSSYGDREKRLNILKDPHSGAFAIIGCGIYMLVSVGLWTEIGYCEEKVMMLGFGFVISRILSGISVVSFPMAKDTGLAKTFGDGASKKVVRAVLMVMLIVILISMLGLSGYMGYSYDMLLGNAGIILAALVTFIYYYVFSRKIFGGITGDIAGYFLQLCELMMLLVIAVV